MKKWLRALSLAAAVVLLGACATMPPPDKGNKTLLVIAVKLATQGSYGLAYDFLIKDSQLSLPVNPQNGVVFYDHLPPGTYTIDRYRTTIGPGAGGGSLIGGAQVSELRPPVTITLTEGTITILPFTVVMAVESRPDRTLQGWGPVPTNRDEVLAELAKYDSFPKWKVAP